MTSPPSHIAPISTDRVESETDSGTVVSAEAARAKKHFFIVFSPEGTTPPVRVHPTHSSALYAAWEMARVKPGQTFYVMGAVSRPCVVSAGEEVQ